MESQNETVVGIVIEALRTAFSGKGRAEELLEAAIAKRVKNEKIEKNSEIERLSQEDFEKRLLKYVEMRDAGEDVADERRLLVEGFRDFIEARPNKSGDGTFDHVYTTQSFGNEVINSHRDLSAMFQEAMMANSVVDNIDALMSLNETERQNMIYRRRFAYRLALLFDKVKSSVLGFDDNLDSLFDHAEDEVKFVVRVDGEYQHYLIPNLIDDLLEIGDDLEAEWLVNRINVFSNSQPLDYGLKVQDYIATRVLVGQDEKQREGLRKYLRNVMVVFLDDNENWRCKLPRDSEQYKSDEDVYSICELAASDVMIGKAVLLFRDRDYLDQHNQIGFMNAVFLGGLPKLEAFSSWIEGYNSSFTVNLNNPVDLIVTLEAEDDGAKHSYLIENFLELVFDGEDVTLDIIGRKVKKAVELQAFKWERNDYFVQGELANIFENPEVEVGLRLVLDPDSIGDFKKFSAGRYTEGDVASFYVRLRQGRMVGRDMLYLNSFLAVSKEPFRNFSIDTGHTEIGINLLHPFNQFAVIIEHKNRMEVNDKAFRDNLNELYYMISSLYSPEKVREFCDEIAACFEENADLLSYKPWWLEVEDVKDGAPSRNYSKLNRRAAANSLVKSFGEWMSFLDVMKFYPVFYSNFLDLDSDEDKEKYVEDNLDILFLTKNLSAFAFSFMKICSRHSDQDFRINAWVKFLERTVDNDPDGDGFGSMLGCVFHNESGTGMPVEAIAAVSESSKVRDGLCGYVSADGVSPVTAAVAEFLLGKWAGSQQGTNRRNAINYVFDRCFMKSESGLLGFVACFDDVQEVIEVMIQRAFVDQDVRRFMNESELPDQQDEEAILDWVKALKKTVPEMVSFKDSDLASVYSHLEGKERKMNMKKTLLEFELPFSIDLADYRDIISRIRKEKTISIPERREMTDLLGLKGLFRVFIEANPNCKGLLDWRVVVNFSRKSGIDTYAGEVVADFVGGNLANVESSDGRKLNAQCKAKLFQIGVYAAERYFVKAEESLKFLGNESGDGMENVEEKDLGGEKNINDREVNAQEAFRRTKNDLTVDLRDRDERLISGAKDVERGKILRSNGELRKWINGEEYDFSKIRLYRLKDMEVTSQGLYRLIPSDELEVMLSEGNLNEDEVFVMNKVPHKKVLPYYLKTAREIEGEAGEVKKIYGLKSKSGSLNAALAYDAYMVDGGVEIPVFDEVDILLKLKCRERAPEVIEGNFLDELRVGVIAGVLRNMADEDWVMDWAESRFLPLLEEIEELEELKRRRLEFSDEKIDLELMRFLERLEDLPEEVVDLDDLSRRIWWMELALDDFEIERLKSAVCLERAIAIEDHELANKCQSRMEFLDEKLDQRLLMEEDVRLSELESLKEKRQIVFLRRSLEQRINFLEKLGLLEVEDIERKIEEAEEGISQVNEEVDLILKKVEIERTSDGELDFVLPLGKVPAETSFVKGGFESLKEFRVRNEVE